MNCGAMSYNVQQVDEERQPQQQLMGYENPPQESQAPPAYDALSLSHSLPRPPSYDQVESMQQSPSLASLPSVSGSSSAHSSVSSPIIADTRTTWSWCSRSWTARLVREAMAARSERGRVGLAHCCRLGNKYSALAILCTLLIFSSLALAASGYILTMGITKEWTDELRLWLIAALPVAILFPCSLAALVGAIRGKTACISLLLGTLTFYCDCIALLALLTFMVILLLGICVLLAVLFTPLTLFLLLLLTVLGVGIVIIQVLSDYRLSLRGEGSSTRG